MAAIEKAVRLHWFGDIGLIEQFCSPIYHARIEARLAALAAEAGECDLRLANFEAPIWGDGGINIRKNPRICTTEQAAKSIVPLHLDVAFLGNNHIYDCLSDGFAHTTKFLGDNKIKYLGAGWTIDEARRPVVLEKRGQSVGILNYVHPNTNPNLPEDAQIVLNMFDEDRALREIADLAGNVDIVVVYLHWGKCEFVRLPDPEHRRVGRSAIEKGAKVVVFDHAHCLQPSESWRDGMIYYGFGNLIFGDLPGKTWPRVCSPTGMADIEVSGRGVERSRLRLIEHDSGMPVWSHRQKTEMAYHRLQQKMVLPEVAYARWFKFELFYQLRWRAWVDFVLKHGGIIPAVLKLRVKHLRKLLGRSSG